MSPKRANGKRTGRNKADNGSKWIRKEKRWAIYRRDDFKCVYCGIEVEVAPHGFTLDHLLSPELGGSNHESNLVTACKVCNSAKGKKSKAQFIKWLQKEKGQSPEDVAKRIRNTIRRKLRK